MRQHLFLVAALCVGTLPLLASLPRPTAPNPKLYPPPQEARQELREAEQRAAHERKRVLVVFGANWCGDCHALDAAFHSPDLAPIVNGNYVVVHVNIGDEGKDNHEMADQFGVALRKGIPALAVLEPSGKVIMAQKDGEFESSTRISEDDVRGFLEKYKRR